MAKVTIRYTYDYLDATEEEVIAAIKRSLAGEKDVIGTEKENPVLGKFKVEDVSAIVSIDDGHHAYLYIEDVDTEVEGATR